MTVSEEEMFRRILVFLLNLDEDRLTLTQSWTLKEIINELENVLDNKP